MRSCRSRDEFPVSWVQNVQSVQAVQNVWNDLNYLNGWNSDEYGSIACDREGSSLIVACQ
jgi:hypothetical protein